LTNRRSSLPPPPEAAFGAFVAFFRRRRNLTGAKLGKLLGWSQPKVSKIETGAVIPSPQDVERLAQALTLSAKEATDLRARAEQSRNQVTDWRIGRQDPAVWQRDIARLENESVALRVFQPTVLSGLLQTSENARAILTDLQRTWSGRQDAASIAAAVSARVQRQEILEDREKSFVFVLPETVLRGLLSQGVDLPAQLARIRAVAAQDNVDLRILTDETRRPFPLTNGFYLLDDRYVVIDLFNTIVVARSESDLRLYREVFDAVHRVATTDLDPTMEKYRRLYLEREAGVRPTV
jgi:transcriptional regulator with XRE-family HTH domain